MKKPSLISIHCPTCSSTLAGVMEVTEGYALIGGARKIAYGFFTPQYTGLTSTFQGTATLQEGPAPGDLKMYCLTCGEVFLFSTKTGETRGLQPLHPRSKKPWKAGNNRRAKRVKRS